MSRRIGSSCPRALYMYAIFHKISYKIIRQNGSFWNCYKMIGIIKALKCCQNLYQLVEGPCPVAFLNDDPGLTLTIFMTGSNLFPDASSVTVMVDQLGWRTLEQRRADARLCLFHKIVYGLVAVPLPDYIQLTHRVSRYCHSMTFR